MGKVQQRMHNLSLLLFNNVHRSLCPPGVAHLFSLLMLNTCKTQGGDGRYELFYPLIYAVLLGFNGEVSGSCLQAAILQN